MRDILIVCLSGDRHDAALVHQGACLAAAAEARAEVLVLEREAVAPMRAAGGSSVVWLPAQTADDMELARALAQYCRKRNFSAVLCNATVRGRSVMPMTAALLETGLTADCTALEMRPDGTLVQTRPALGGNVLARIGCTAFPQMATVRPGVFGEPPQMKECGACGQEPEKLEWQESPRVKLIARKPLGYVSTLAQADIVVAGGLGVGGKKGFDELALWAKSIGAGVAATRAAVQAGWAPYSCQVGQTGITIRPRLYIAVGISGAVQHLAGMSGAETVFAVNSDPRAPIFEYADYAVVGDWACVRENLEHATGKWCRAKGSECNEL